MSVLNNRLTSNVFGEAMSNTTRMKELYCWLGALALAVSAAANPQEDKDGENQTVSAKVVVLDADKLDSEGTASLTLKTVKDGEGTITLEHSGGKITLAKSGTEGLKSGAPVVSTADGWITVVTAEPSEGDKTLPKIEHKVFNSKMPAATTENQKMIILEFTEDTPFEEVRAQLEKVLEKGHAVSLRIVPEEKDSNEFSGKKASEVHKQTEKKSDSAEQWERDKPTIGFDIQVDRKPIEKKSDSAEGWERDKPKSESKVSEEKRRDRSSAKRTSETRKQERKVVSPAKERREMMMRRRQAGMMEGGRREMMERRERIASESRDRMQRARGSEERREAMMRRRQAGELGRSPREVMETRERVARAIRQRVGEAVGSGEFGRSMMRRIRAAIPEDKRSKLMELRERIGPEIHVQIGKAIASGEFGEALMRRIEAAIPEEERHELRELRAKIAPKIIEQIGDVIGSNEHRDVIRRHVQSHIPEEKRQELLEKRRVILSEAREIGSSVNPGTIHIDIRESHVDGKDHDHDPDGHEVRLLIEQEKREDLQHRQEAMQLMREVVDRSEKAQEHHDHDHDRERGHHPGDHHDHDGWSHHDDHDGENHHDDDGEHHQGHDRGEKHIHDKEVGEVHETVEKLTKRARNLQNEYEAEAVERKEKYEEQLKGTMIRIKRLRALLDGENEHHADGEHHHDRDHGEKRAHGIEVGEAQEMIKKLAEKLQALTEEYEAGVAKRIEQHNERLREAHSRIISIQEHHYHERDQHDHDGEGYHDDDDREHHHDDDGEHHHDCDYCEKHAHDKESREAQEMVEKLKEKSRVLHHDHEAKMAGWKDLKGNIMAEEAKELEIWELKLKLREAELNYKAKQLELEAREIELKHKFHEVEQKAKMLKAKEHELELKWKKINSAAAKLKK